MYTFCNMRQALFFSRSRDATICPSGNQRPKEKHFYIVIKILPILLLPILN